MCSVLAIVLVVMGVGGQAFAQQQGQELEGGDNVEPCGPNEEDGTASVCEREGRSKRTSAWTLGPRIGLILHDVNPNDAVPDRRQTAFSGLVGLSGVWLHRHDELGWQAGYELGIWLKTWTAEADGVGRASVAVPFMARLQYDFGRVTPRYQMGLSVGTTTSVHEVLSTHVGVGCDFRALGESFSFDLIYQASPIESWDDSRDFTQSTVYMGNLGVELW